MQRINSLKNQLETPGKGTNKLLTPKDVENLTLAEIRERYGSEKKDAVQIQGVNHVAFVASNMARTIWFWSEILGLTLVKTLALPDGGQHFFLGGGNQCAIAYFWWPETPKAEPGVSNVDIERLMKTGGRFETAAGSVNHVAFNVPESMLFEYRKRVKSTGAWVSPMLYHSDASPTGYSPEKDEYTTWMSFYFSGPDGEYLELTAQTTRPFTAEQDVNHPPAHDSKLTNGVPL